MPAGEEKRHHANKASCSDLITNRLKEVEYAYDKLESKHRGSYSKEQLRTWAHLIQMDKWSSYETPPNDPLFKNRTVDSATKVTILRKGPLEKAQKNLHLGNAGNEMGISLIRRSNLQSQYMSQIEHRHKLLEARAISQEKYEDHKSVILSDMKKISTTSVACITYTVMKIHTQMSPHPACLIQPLQSLGVIVLYAASKMC